MPEQRFSIGESGALLDIDRVTLQRWMQLEGIEPLSDPRDKRYRYLTRDMIHRLAKAHNRSVRDETSIGPRLTGVQRELVGRIQRLEEGHADLGHKQDEIMARLDALLSNISEWDRRTSERYVGLRELARLNQGTAQNAPQARSEAHQAVVPSSEVSEYPTWSDVPQNEPEQPFIIMPQVRTLRPAPRGALKRGEWATLPDIPPGWITPVQMALELGVPPRTFNHALAPQESGDREREGDIPYHEGRWRHTHKGAPPAADLLDPEQQAIARSRFPAQR